jgi:hypothetical protein
MSLLNGHGHEDSGGVIGIGHRRLQSVVMEGLHYRLCGSGRFSRSVGGWLSMNLCRNLYRVGWPLVTLHGASRNIQYVQSVGQRLLSIEC